MWYSLKANRGQPTTTNHKKMNLLQEISAAIDCLDIPKLQELSHALDFYMISDHERDCWENIINQTLELAYHLDEEDLKSLENRQNYPCR